MMVSRHRHWLPRLQPHIYVRPDLVSHGSCCGGPTDWFASASRRRRRQRCYSLSSVPCCGAGEAVPQPSSSTTSSSSPPPQRPNVTVGNRNNDHRHHHQQQPPPRKHVGSLAALTERTEALLAYSRRNRANNNSNGGSVRPHPQRPPKRRLPQGRPLASDFFHVLEAWMEQSMAGHGLAAAQKAYRLLTVLLPPLPPPPSPLLIDDDASPTLEQPPLPPGSVAALPRPTTAPFRFDRAVAHSPPSDFLASIVTTSHYDVVLQAYAVSGAGRRAAEAAEALLVQMLEACRAHVSAPSPPPSSFAEGPPPMKTPKKQAVPPPEPTIKTFNIVLNCWAKSEASDSAERATRVVELMEEWTRECRNDAHDDSRTYQGCYLNERSLVSLMEAWTHSRPDEAPERALAMLQEAMFVADHPHNTDNSNPIRGSSGSSSVTDARSLRDDDHDDRDQYGGHIRRYRHVQLDDAVFNAVIYAWVRSRRGRRAAVQAEEILQLMVQWSQVRHPSPDGRNRSSIHHRARVQPTTRTYSLIIAAWAGCERREQRGDAARRAEAILWHMVQRHREGRGGGGSDSSSSGGSSDNHKNDSAMKPNVILFTTCVAAWSWAAIRCYDAPERAEQLWTMLNDLYTESECTDPDLEPSTELGNAVISTWSRCSSRADSVERACGALETLKQAQKADLISYNTVLDAMSKKGMGDEAIQLLQWLEDNASSNSSNGGPTCLMPDKVSYNSVLAALSRSNSNWCASAEKAEELLRKMETLDPWTQSDILQHSLDGKIVRYRRPDKLSYTCTFGAMYRRILFKV